MGQLDGQVGDRGGAGGGGREGARGHKKGRLQVRVRDAAELIESCDERVAGVEIDGHQILKGQVESGKGSRRLVAL